MATNKSSADGGMSTDTKTLLTVLLLIFAYPVGLIMMFVWMKWKWWVKLLVALPVTFLLFLGVSIIAVAMLAAVNPGAQIKKAECVKQCQAEGKSADCTGQCSEVLDEEVTPTVEPVVKKSVVTPRVPVVTKTPVGK